MDQAQFKRHFELHSTHWWSVATNHFFYNQIIKYLPRNSIILDAGCGVGGMIEVLRNDYLCIGVDVSKIGLELSQSHNCKSIINGSVEVLPFKANTFQSVISLDVLYHNNVKDDVVALKEMTRVLKPGGFIFLQLPAYEWMRSIHDKKAHSIRRYTTWRLRDLFEVCNLIKVKLSYRVSFLLPFAIIHRKFLKKTEDSDFRRINPVANWVLNKIMKLENKLLENYNLYFGLSVIAIAQKK